MTNEKPSKTLGFCLLRRLVEGHFIIFHMRARMENNKSTQRTWRTGLKSDLLTVDVSCAVRSPIESLRTRGCSPSIDAGLRFRTSRLQPAFESRTTLRTDARSLPSRPTSRPSRPSRQWANCGPTVRLPVWHPRSPQRMGPPPKINASLGCGKSRASHHSLFVLSGRLPPNFHKEIYMDWDTAMRRELKRFNAAAKRAIATPTAATIPRS